MIDPIEYALYARNERLKKREADKQAKITRQLRPTRTTRHSRERADERCRIKNDREYTRMVSLAFNRGRRAEEMRRTIDRRYLASRSTAEKEAVAYNGMCFIFNRVDGTCITVFPLPRHFGCKNRSEYERRRLPVRGGDYELYA